jgi:hypothetical protein
MGLPRHEIDWQRALQKRAAERIWAAGMQRVPLHTLSQEVSPLLEHMVYFIKCATVECSRYSINARSTLKFEIAPIAPRPPLGDPNRLSRHN